MPGEREQGLKLPDELDEGYCELERAVRVAAALHAVAELSIGHADLAQELCVAERGLANLLEVVGDEHVRALVNDARERVDRGERTELARDVAGLLAQLAGRGLLGGLACFDAAAGELEDPALHGMAVGFH